MERTVLRRDADRLLAEFLIRDRRGRASTAAIDERIAFSFLDWARERPRIRLGSGGVAEWMLGWFPGMGLIPSQDLRRVPVVLGALVRFLAERGKIEAGESRRMLATIRLNRAPFLAAARDPSRWTAAKLAALGEAPRRPPQRAPGRASVPRVVV